MQTVFGTAALSFTDGLAIIGAGIALLLVLEVEKRIGVRFAGSTKPPMLAGASPRSR
jgi:hypothetical protein